MALFLGFCLICQLWKTKCSFKQGFLIGSIVPGMDYKDEVHFNYKKAKCSFKQGF